MKVKIPKGVLSFLSGLGLMGLAFYIWFFTIYSFNWKINKIFIYSISTAVLGAMVIYFVAIAFSLIPSKIGNTTTGGFLGGILSMTGVILMLLSLRTANVSLFSKIHPIITFFLAAACTYLLIIPEEEKEEWKL
ncbi:MAG: hypothetical protein FE045_04905 [Thermoplasmata archaeon]|nr:MAG: hypothetical protein FE045_04905 [Thermoplasmata archaeon]